MSVQAIREQTGNKAQTLQFLKMIGLRITPNFLDSLADVEKDSGPLAWSVGLFECRVCTVRGILAFPDVMDTENCECNNCGAMAAYLVEQEVGDG